MTFFNKQPKFPPVNPNRGKITYTEHHITVKNTMYQEEDKIIPIDKIERIYLEICDYSEPGIFIRQGNDTYIPGDYVGTEDLWIALSKRFNFSMDEVYCHLDETKNAIYCLYKTTYRKNYSLTDQLTKDSKLGFEILAPTPLFIPWFSTKSEVANCPLITLEQNYLQTDYPVRIGSIILERLSASLYNCRPEVAISKYNAECYDTDGSEKSFFELKKAIEDDLGQQASYTFYDEHQLSFYAKTEYITITLHFTKDDSESRTIGDSYTSLGIETDYEYDELLECPDYEDKIEVSAVLLLPYRVHTPSHYKSEERIKKTPSKLKTQCENNAIIWIDQKNSVIGFADSEHALWFGLTEIDQLVLWNILPAKGGGYCDLSVRLKEGKLISVFSGEHDTLKFHLKEMNNFLPLEVIFNEDFNC